MTVPLIDHTLPLHLIQEQCYYLTKGTPSYLVHFLLIEPIHLMHASEKHKTRMSDFSVRQNRTLETRNQTVNILASADGR